MGNNVLRYLAAIEKIFGDDIIIKKKNIHLPYVYWENFLFYDVEGHMPFIYIVPNNDSIPIDLLIGIYKKLITEYKCRVVLYLQNSSNNYKLLFKESNISYISSDFDYFLSQNNEIRDLSSISPDFVLNNYTKSTQLVLNFYLTNPISKYSTREIASKYNFSFSSVSRANAFLHEIGGLDKEGTGNTAKYIVRSKKELLNKAKPYLINPIRKRKTTLLDIKQIKKIEGLISGDNALSHFSNLEENRDFIEIALSSINFDKYKNKTSNNGDLICYLEEFIYDPFLFSIDSKYISLLDTYIICLKRFENSSDVRLKTALTTLERKLINGDQQ